MSMQHSLELRTPFLDYRLVERAMAIPAQPQDARTDGEAAAPRPGARSAARPL